MAIRACFVLLSYVMYTEMQLFRNCCMIFFMNMNKITVICEYKTRKIPISEKTSSNI